MIIFCDRVRHQSGVGARWRRWYCSFVLISGSSEQLEWWMSRDNAPAWASVGLTAKICTFLWLSLGGAKGGRGGRAVTRCSVAGAVAAPLFSARCIVLSSDIQITCMISDACNREPGFKEVALVPRKPVCGEMPVEDGALSWNSGRSSVFRATVRRACAFSRKFT